MGLLKKLLFGLVEALGKVVVGSSSWVYSPASPLVEDRCYRRLPLGANHPPDSCMTLLDSKAEWLLEPVLFSALEGSRVGKPL